MPVLAVEGRTDTLEQAAGVSGQKEGYRALIGTSGMFTRDGMAGCCKSSCAEHAGEKVW